METSCPRPGFSFKRHTNGIEYRTVVGFVSGFQVQRHVDRKARVFALAWDIYSIISESSSVTNAVD